ncbi:MAG: hypothetical protein HYY18_15985 [Planctomycetes bacterium]|nr:hypothetical protein [Planctomycetota bacterium]
MSPEFRFDCECGRLLSVPQELRGRRVRCPACREVVVAEERLREETPAPVAAPEPPAPPPDLLRCVPVLAVAGLAWTLGFAILSARVSDVAGHAILAATYLVAPAVVYRASRRESVSARFLLPALLLLAVAAAWHGPAVVSWWNELQATAPARP